MVQYKAFLLMIAVIILSNINLIAQKGQSMTPKIDKICFLYAKGDSSMCFLNEVFTYKDEHIIIRFSFKNKNDIKRIMSSQFAGIELTIDGKSFNGKPNHILSSRIPESDFFYDVDDEKKIIIFSPNIFIVTNRDAVIKK